MKLSKFIEQLQNIEEDFKKSYPDVEPSIWEITRDGDTTLVELVEGVQKTSYGRKSTSTVNEEYRVKMKWA